MPAPADLVHETSTSTGTGNLTLAPANGKRQFSTAFGIGATPDVFDYFISSQSAAEWERGTGHMSDATTLVRDTVLASSNANALVNFSAGTKDIANDVPADNQYHVGGPDVALADGGTGASLSDPGADQLAGWDESANTFKFFAGTDFGVEAAPATGDSVVLYRAEGDVALVDWANLPGAAGYTDEQAQDAVGGILVDSTTIDFTYDDTTPQITADVVNDSITNAKLANMAESTVKGRAVGAGTGDPADLTSAQLAAIVLLEEATIEAAIDTLANLTSIQGFTVALSDPGADAIFGWDDSANAWEALTSAEATAVLDIFTSTLKGLAPASGGGTANFLRADGTWATPPAAGGGDSISVNTIAATDAEFNDSTPAAPASTFNVKWQMSGASPSSISAYVPQINSATLAALLTDETGSGLAVFGTSPVFTTPQINDTSSDHQYIFAVNELAADRTVTLPLLTGNDTFVFAAHTQTLTNKTIDLTDNTVTGTMAEFNAAISDGDIQPLDATLTALAAYNTNGLLTQTAADTFTGRTIAGTTNEIEVTNGNGVSGNPTIGLPNDVVITTTLTLANSGLHLFDTNASHDLIVTPGSDLTADRILTVTTGDRAHTIDFTDPGAADTFWGWDDSADRWEALTAAEAAAIISGTNTFQPLDADLTSWAGVTRAAGFDTFVITPSSANLAALVTNETGTGALVFASGPVLTTPEINDSASDHQYVFAVANLAADRTVSLPLLTGNDTFVFEAHTQTLTNKTINLSSNTLTGTMAQFNTAISDGNIQPEDATLTALAAFNTNGILVQTAADTFAGRTIIGTTNEVEVTNGDGVAGNPTIGLPNDVIIATSLTLANTGLHLLDTNASHDLIIAPGSNLTADRTLTLTTGDASVTLDLTAVTDEFVLAYDTGTNTWRGVAASGGIPTLITVADESADTSCFVAFFTAATGDLGPKTNANLTFNSNTGALGTTTIELGHASDTTLARVSAGVISVEGIAFTPSDAGFDALFGWDDSAATYKSLLLADIAVEGAPATGDFIPLIGAEGDLRRVNWSSLPGASGGIGNVVEDATPELGGDLESNNNDIIIEQYSADAVDGELIFHKSRNASIGSHTVVQADDDIGTIRFMASDGTNHETAAMILAEIDDADGAAPGNNDMPGRLSFWTTPDASVTPVERLRLDNAGRLIYGSGGDGVTIDGTYAATQFHAADDPIIGFSSWATDGESPYSVQFFHSKSGTVGSHTAVADGDRLGEFAFLGSDGTDGVACAQMLVVVDGTVGSGSVPSMFILNVSNGSDTQRRLVVNNAGNVGLSTEEDAPARRLEIREENSATDTVTILERLSVRSIGTPVAGIGAGLEFEVHTSTTPNYEVGGRIAVAATDVGGGTEDFDFILSLMTAGAAVAEKFRVTSLGNVQATSLSGTWVATQAQQETGTDVTTVVTPGRQHFHPSAAKFWVYWTGGSTTILSDYNVDTIANTGTGDADGTITTDFSSANWAGFVTTNDASTNGWDADSIQSAGFNARAAGTFGVLCGFIIDGGTAAAALVNPQQWQVVGFGDH